MAGAPVVLKPPPQAPLTAHLLGALADEAGLPAGGFNVVHAAPEVAQRLVEDERMKVLSFTGSDAVGWRLKALAGKKPVLLELGGNAPCVLDVGCDLDAALPLVLAGAWGYAGQVCIKVQRLFVHQSIFETALTRFVEATRALPVGDPLDEETVVGPLIEPRHVARVAAWIGEAVAGGARLHLGGEVKGQLVTPAVLTGVPSDARVLTEEVFGPVTVLQPFADFDEALALCNAGRFGLQAGVFTPRLDHALAAFRQLAYGGVIINDVPTFRLDHLPYGGSRDSGLGREGVRSAIDELTEPRTLILRA
jgi:glyceraldehyde-3-phosphate dehydrogenase (NADP+)